MKIVFTRSFARDYQRLPERVREQVEKQLDFLMNNPRHPSLNLKILNDPRDIWEGRVSSGYRFTFHIKNDMYVLRKVGTHDVLLNP